MCSEAETKVEVCFRLLEAEETKATSEGSNKELGVSELSTLNPALKPDVREPCL